ncbi:MAG: CoA pyrophosphatase [Bradymonadaceae bacterium]
MTDGVLDPERIRARLRQLGDEPRASWRGSEDFPVEELTDASVLGPLTEIDGEFYLLFTHRSDELDNHSSEVSFPGGRPEEEDRDRLETALREAEEEVGLAPEDVEVYGALVELPTVTGFRMRAYVGEFDQPYELDDSSPEIQEIFLAPLSHLADPAHHRIEQREYGGRTFPVHFYEYGDQTIWGATGFLLYTLLDYLELERDDE